MIRLSLVIIFFFFFGAKFSAQDTSFKYYKELNEKETRLAEYKDKDEELKIKIKQLALINKNRTKHGVQEVKLDILASRVAKKMCKESAENAYLGHWNMAGEKPYHRYAFAGGKDHVSENAASRSISGSSFDQTPNGISDNMVYLHETFMSERAPNDGHKKNCIEKNHNYVGIGYYSTSNEFRYYEEYIDRYVNFENVPSTVKPNEKFNLKITTAPGQFLYFATVYYEDFPKPKSPRDIERKDSYEDYGTKEVLTYAPWQFASFRKNNLYSIPLKFKKPGLYYIQIYIDNKENKSKKSFNTKGKILAAGIVVRVE